MSKFKKNILENVIVCMRSFTNMFNKISLKFHCISLNSVFTEFIRTIVKEKTDLEKI